MIKANQSKRIFAFIVIAALLLCVFLPGCTAENRNRYDPDISTPTTIVEGTGGAGGAFQSAIDKAFEGVQSKPSEPAPTPYQEPIIAENPVSTSEDGLRVDFVDVGQADFIVVECEGHYMTIDGGNVADSQLIYSYLEQRGIEHLDYVIITHAHEDHCGGVAAILSRCTAGAVFSPVTEYNTKAFRNVVKKANEQGLNLVIPEAGTVLKLGTAEIEVLGPVKEYSDPNNTSVVLKLNYGSTSFLFTGDAEAQAEKDILDAGYDVSATVLKVGHHGSSTSTCYQFLREVMPDYAVISSNREEVPEYDHPHNAVLSRLRDAEVKVYRTDLQGTVTCWSNGNTVRFAVERAEDLDTLYELKQER